MRLYTGSCGSFSSYLLPIQNACILSQPAFSEICSWPQRFQSQDNLLCTFSLYFFPENQLGLPIIATLLPVLKPFSLGMLRILVCLVLGLFVGLVFATLLPESPQDIYHACRSTIGTKCQKIPFWWNWIMFLWYCLKYVTQDQNTFWVIRWCQTNFTGVSSAPFLQVLPLIFFFFVSSILLWSLMYHFSSTRNQLSFPLKCFFLPPHFPITQSSFLWRSLNSLSSSDLLSSFLSPLWVTHYCCDICLLQILTSLRREHSPCLWVPSIPSWPSWPLPPPLSSHLNSCSDAHLAQLWLRLILLLIREIVGALSEGLQGLRISPVLLAVPCWPWALV